MSFYAYKVRIYPNKTQKELINRTLGCTRKMWNLMLNERKEVYEKLKHDKQALKNYKYKTVEEYKEEYPYMKECDAQAFKYMLLDLNSAHKRFFNKTSQFPKFKKKFIEESYSSFQSTIKLNRNDKTIQLVKLGNVKYRNSNDKNIIGKIKRATISRDASGNYFCSLLFDVGDVAKTPKIAIHNENQIIGLDMSLGKFYVDSNGKSPNYEKLYRKSEQRLKYLNKMKSRKKKGSREYKKIARSIARVNVNIKNKRNDFILKTAQRLTTDYDKIVVEDLNMKGMSQCLNLGKSVHDVGWGTFISKLEYYCNKKGKKLEKADRFFPSSKTCSSCGKIKKELTLNERIFICDCGLSIDRDRNAALNLLKFGLKGSPSMLVEPLGYQNYEASNGISYVQQTMKNVF